MFKRLLLPLDGSQLAESILPVAVCLVKSLHASVVLIHIIERNPPQEIHGEKHLTDVSRAESYLSEIATKWFEGKATVETHVHSEAVEDVPKSILQHVHELHSDLTLMCTHGKSGPREFLYGSISQQIAAASVPVLFIRASESALTAEYALRHVIVPLDGDPDHEQGLHVGADLAKVCNADIHLMTVVPSLIRVSGTWTQSVRLLPGTADRMLGMEVAEAEAYLTDLQEELAHSALRASAEVLRGDPAEQIVRAAEARKTDLLVLGTHGTVGAKAFWSGSVTAQIARTIQVPVLLVPAATEHRV